MDVFTVDKSMAQCHDNARRRDQGGARRVRPVNGRELQRAERVLRVALTSMLDNQVLDVAWFNTADLRPENLFRGDHVSGIVIADIAETLRREIRRAARWPIEASLAGATLGKPYSLDQVPSTPPVSCALVEVALPSVETETDCQTNEFLKLLFGGKQADEYVLIWRLRDKHSAWFQDLSAAAEHVRRHRAEDVYVGVALSPKDHGPGLRLAVDQNKRPPSSLIGLMGRHRYSGRCP